jgi:hypothetical protein
MDAIYEHTPSNVLNAFTHVLLRSVSDPNPKVSGPLRSGSIIICTDSDQDQVPSINKHKIKKNLDFNSFLLLVIFAN